MFFFFLKKLYIFSDAVSPKKRSPTMKKLPKHSKIQKFPLKKEKKTKNEPIGFHKVVAINPHKLTFVSFFFADSNLETRDLCSKYLLLLFT